MNVIQYVIYSRRSTIDTPPRFLALSKRMSRSPEHVFDLYVFETSHKDRQQVHHYLNELLLSGDIVFWSVKRGAHERENR